MSNHEDKRLQKAREISTGIQKKQNQMINWLGIQLECDKIEERIKRSQSHLMRMCQFTIDPLFG